MIDHGTKMNQIEEIVAEQCFTSTSVDEMQAEIGRNYCDHDLKVVRSNSDITGKFFRYPMRGMTLNYLSYGADVAIDAGDFEDFYMVEFPLSGHVNHLALNEARVAHGWEGIVVSPGDYVRSTWSADCAQLMLQIKKGAIDRYLQKLLVQDISESLVFDHTLTFKAGPGAALFSYLRFLVEQAIDNDSIMLSSMVRDEMEETIYAILLDRFRHNYSDRIKAERALILPRHVSKAYKYINANPKLPITNQELANMSGVSIRTLYSGFRKFLGMSPQAYLRNYRLDRVKEVLERADRPIHVNEIAQEWGFTHMGRFSVEFRQRFGVSPSDLLRG
ncbi:MAG: AraC family transcriptional regulator [Pseudomonadota bacterium]